MGMEFSTEQFNALKDSITCPINQEIFLDPVVIPACGHSFERVILNKALAMRMQCPLCREKVTVRDLKRNFALVETINAILDIFPELAADQFLSAPYLLDLVHQDKSNQLLKILKAHPKWLMVEIEPGKTLLTAAIETGKTAVVDMLLQNFSFDLNQIHHPNPLLHAMQSASANAEVVRLLLAHGANPKTVAEDGGTALMIGLWFNFADRVQALLDCGKDLNINQQLKSTQDSALMLAARKTDVNIFKAMLDQPGIDINATNRKGKTALYIAASAGQFDKIRLLMQHAEVDVVSENAKGNTALYTATQHSQVKVVELLTSLTAQVMMLKNFLDKKDLEKAAIILTEIYHNYDNTTFTQVLTELLASHGEIWPSFAIKVYQHCLPSMVEKEDISLLNLLINLADKPVLNDKVEGGAFCYWAVRFKRLDFLKQIVKNHPDKVDLNLLAIFKNQEVTPLNLAIMLGDQAMVQFLLQHNANPCIPLEDNALSIAVLNKNKSIIQLVQQNLSQRYARKFSQQDMMSIRKPMFHALQLDNESFNALLSLPAVDVNYKYPQDKTLLHYAVDLNDAEKVKSILLKSGLNFHAKNSAGLDAADYANQIKNHNRQPLVGLLNVFNASLYLIGKQPRQKMKLDDLQTLTPEKLDFLIKALKVQSPECRAVDGLCYFLSRLLNVKVDGTKVELQYVSDANNFKENIGVLNRFFLLAHDSYYKNRHNWEKAIRREAFQQLNDVLQNMPQDEQFEFLQWARTQPLFAHHRNFLSLGRTRTVIEIDKLISKLNCYPNDVPKTRPVIM